MSVTIRLEGSEELQAALRRASGEIKQAVSRAVVGTALELQGNIKKSIAQGPASGRTYEKYNPRRTHTASAPGQPPMTDTGRLVNSIEFDKIGDLTATVGSKLVYAPYLEYGTSRMAARPFFRPAIEEIRPKYMARLEKTLGDELR
jgi:HK97 gp10 family phage protein